MAKTITKTPSLGGIYRITCTVEGKEKSYIGSTKHPFKRRWRDHQGGLKASRHRNIHLQKAWNKYGESAFEFHPLEPVAFVEDLIEAEQRWIDIYQACDRAYGYNIRPRADRKCLSQETKEKLRAAHLGKKLSPEHRAKFSAIRLGRKPSPEAISNMKAAQSAPEVRSKMRAAKLGTKHTPETKAKIRAAGMGKKHTPERIAKAKATKTKKRSFYYRAIAPDGTVYDYILNMAEFCREHGLSKREGNCMTSVADGRRSHHRGWTGEKINKIVGITTSDTF